MQGQGSGVSQVPQGGGNYMHQPPMMPVNMMPQSNQFFHPSQLQQNMVEQPRTRMSIYELPQSYNQSASLSKYLKQGGPEQQQQQNNQFKHPSVLPRKDLPTSPLQRLAPTGANAGKPQLGNPVMQKVGNMQSPPNYQQQNNVQSIQPPNNMNSMNNLQNHINTNSEPYYSNPANTAPNFSQIQPPNTFNSNPSNNNNNFRNPSQSQPNNNPLELSNTPTPPHLSRTPPNPFPPSPAPPKGHTEQFDPFSDFLADDQSEVNSIFIFLFLIFSSHFELFLSFCSNFISRMQ